MGGINLFCFPFAGGSSTYYMRWQKYLHPGIDLKIIELSGRGNRITEPLYEEFEELIDDVYMKIRNQLLEKPYALFGHSMGSLITYELTRVIQQKDNNLPVHLFCSGRNSPNKKSITSMHKLPDEEFKNEVLLLGGTPKEVLAWEELMEIFMPILKSDFKIVENYEHRFIYGNEKVRVPMTILNGIQDQLIDIKELEEWREFSTEQCSFHLFNDDHFFINKHVGDITKIINNTLIDEKNYHQLKII